MLFLPKEAIVKFEKSYGRSLSLRRYYNKQRMLHGGMKRRRVDADAEEKLKRRRHFSTVQNQNLGTLQDTSFESVLRYFRRAQSIFRETSNLHEFNMRSSGHPIGEGRIKNIPHAFEYLKGYVDMCVDQLLSIQNDSTRRREFEAFFAREANLASCMDALSDVVSKFFAKRMEASELPSFILSIIDEKLALYTKDIRYTRGFKDIDILDLIRQATRSSPPPKGTNWRELLGVLHDHINERLTMWIDANAKDERRKHQVRSLIVALKQRTTL